MQNPSRSPTPCALDEVLLEESPGGGARREGGVAPAALAVAGAPVSGAAEGVTGDTSTDELSLRTKDTARQLASLRQQSEESHHRVRTLEQQNARECLFYKQSSRELKRRLKELSEARTGVDSNAFLPEPPTSHSHPAPRSAPSSSVSAPPLHCSVPRPRRN